MSSTKHIFISGRVQNVGYRQFTYKKAKEAGLNGWVRNLDDGRVEVLVQGEESRISDLLNTLEDGPLTARVADMEISDTDHEPLNDFRVRYD